MLLGDVWGAVASRGEHFHPSLYMVFILLFTYLIVMSQNPLEAGFAIIGIVVAFLICGAIADSLFEATNESIDQIQESSPEETNRSIGVLRGGFNAWYVVMGILGFISLVSLLSSQVRR
ncbi:MAG: hypothetical protein QCI38_03175 [Candidatus Thermoplasmatota archaeon]|nr:hypothetical protein [Candidatus Thermoplasmatota archaeon]